MWFLVYVTLVLEIYGKHSHSGSKSTICLLCESLVTLQEDISFLSSVTFHVSHQVSKVEERLTTSIAGEEFLSSR